ncbi:Lar family restriction alleviation protein [Marinobacter sp.]|uniref:Lar family restriction alleviation protein n=1 Tax=Marinobacter sp. TaxID=50741 RepID=UPI000C8CCFDD|nr:Lar family restriction alleviation protein [Marinobacter sp.]MAB53454.1 hypothetical protein [Marinobacter sp.]|tara:strand:+ start:3763 stop:4227 length:465 start_codon:yes stop_codon:yes gene_type:complete
MTETTCGHDWGQEPDEQARTVPDLKPCPFCGEKPELIERSEYGFSITHRMDGRHTVLVLAPTEKEAVDEWNRREATDLYVIWSTRHHAWRGTEPDRYVTAVERASVYSRERAIFISFEALGDWQPGERPDDIPVRVADLPGFARAALNKRGVNQ